MQRKQHSHFHCHRQSYLQMTPKKSRKLLHFSKCVKAAEA